MASGSAVVCESIIGKLIFWGRIEGLPAQTLTGKWTEGKGGHGELIVIARIYELICPKSALEPLDSEDSEEKEEESRYNKES